MWTWLSSASLAAPLAVSDAAGLTAALSGAAPGTVVVLAPGEYATQARIPAGVTVRGDGAGTTAIRSTGTVVVIEAGGVAGIPPTVLEDLLLDASGNGRPLGVSHDVIVRDCRLIGGSATGSGGSLQVNTDVTVTLEGTRVEGGVTDGDGGNVFLSVGAALHATDSSIVGGAAAGSGGGVHARLATVTLVRTDVSGNVAVGDGGGLYLDDTTTTLDGATLFGNGTGGDQRGGGAATDGGSFTARDTDVLENTSSRGGGLFVTNGTRLDVSGGSVSGNLADLAGGGMYVSAAESVVLTDVALTRNRATAGGGLYATGCCSAGFRATRLRVCDNALVGDDAQTTPYGGGMYLLGSSAEIRNVLFLGNRASDLSRESAGALWLEAGTASIENSVFAHSTGFVVGAVGVDPTGVLDLRNSVVAWSQGAPALRVDPVGAADDLVEYSLFHANTPPDADPVELLGPTDLTGADPAFEDAGATACEVEAWVPAEGSPLIDAGDPAIEDPDGSRSDIGLLGGPDAVVLVPVDRDDDGVPDTLDCAPSDPAVLPGAPEVCNGVDDDCDGAVDAADDDAVGLVALAPDGDGDGYAGVGALLVEACPSPTGFAEQLGDCDDADPATRPGAREDRGPADLDCDGIGDLPGALSRHGCGVVPGAPASSLAVLAISAARRRRRGSTPRTTG